MYRNLIIKIFVFEKNLENKYEIIDLFGVLRYNGYDESAYQVLQTKGF